VPATAPSWLANCSGLLGDSLADSATPLRQALDAGDRARLHDIAHRLHGACLYCGVPRLRDAAVQLERMTAPGADAASSDALAEAVARLLQVIEATRCIPDPLGGRQDA